VLINVNKDHLAVDAPVSPISRAYVKKKPPMPTFWENAAIAAYKQYLPFATAVLDELEARLPKKRAWKSLS
jgi:hypothetical protein